MPNLLFICSRNQWRSLTAETIFRKRDDITVKSAGTVAKARIRVELEDVVEGWLGGI